MLRQITLLRFKDDAPETVVDEIGRGFAGLVDVVPGIRRFEFGPDIRLMEGTLDFALVIDFESADAWRAYQDHPDHVAFAGKFIPQVEQAQRVIYEIEAA